MTTIFKADYYDETRVTRRTVEFSENSGRRPWIIREYQNSHYVCGYRSDGAEIPTVTQDQAKRLGCEVAL